MIKVNDCKKLKQIQIFFSLFQLNELNCEFTIDSHRFFRKFCVIRSKKQAISNFCAEMFEVFPNDVKKLQKMFWSLNNILGLYESDKAYPYAMSLLACFTRLKLN